MVVFLFEEVSIGFSKIAIALMCCTNVLNLEKLMQTILPIGIQYSTNVT